MVTVAAADAIVKNDRSSKILAHLVALPEMGVSDGTCVALTSERAQLQLGAACVKTAVAYSRNYEREKATRGGGRIITL
jgi:hypothetical protein